MDAEALLYPRSRFQVLRVLNQAGAPVSLSVVADRAGLIIGSVQQAVRWLLKEKFVTVHKDRNRTCYTITNNSVKEIVSQITEVLEAIQIKEQAQECQRRAKDLLDDLDNRRELINRGRRSFKA